MNQNKSSNYLTFFAMIASSMLAMYILTYLNSYEFSHVRWSDTRLFMTFIMGSAMAVIMLTFMRKMYPNKIINGGIYIGSLIVFVISLFFVRTQTNIKDASWMRAMIPHHSIAILTSENAEIRDIRVQELANEIIEAQEIEIQEMNWLLEDIQQNGIAQTREEADARPVPDFKAES